MTPDPVALAEKRAYARGYAAGRKTKATKASQADAHKARVRRDAFTERAFLAVLPWVMSNTGWGKPGNDGKVVPFSSIEERVRFGWEIARAAAESHAP